MRNQPVKILAGTLIVAAVAVGFHLTNLTEKISIERVEQTNPADLDKLPEPVSVTSRLLFGGDIFYGREVERVSLQQDNPYAYPFSKLDTIGKEKYQAWIANLECPVTNTNIPYSTQKNSLIFNCPPEFLPELGKWFEVVSLANNHTNNVDGQTGLKETREHLEENNIQYFGNYDVSIKRDICEVVVVDARMSYDNSTVADTEIPVALCGVHTLWADPTDSQLAIIKDYALYLPVIVMPHSGVEYQPSQDPERAALFRKMVDYGADVIAGGHPHWVQNTEAYKGKLIAYSMGNLIFDQQFSSEVMRSAMLDITLNISYDDNTAAWLELAPKCKSFQDSCLKTAHEQGLEKLDVTFQHDIVATENPNMLARLADDDTFSAVLERTNWLETLSRLE